MESGREGRVRRAPATAPKRKLKGTRGTEAWEMLQSIFLPERGGDQTRLVRRQVKGKETSVGKTRKEGNADSCFSESVIPVSGGGRGQRNEKRQRPSATIKRAEAWTCKPQIQKNISGLKEKN